MATVFILFIILRTKKNKIKNNKKKAIEPYTTAFYSVQDADDRQCLFVSFFFF